MRGCQVFRNGGSALDACEEAIKCLENSGNTNAGYGSNLTWDGTVECDASIMDGSTLLFGSCTNVSLVKNPISLARIICERQSRMLALERIPPMSMAGDGATKYAQEVGCIMLEKDQLISGRAQRLHNHYKEKVARFEDINKIQINYLDTVGAICVDANGNTAAGCSSGGLVLKVSGRIGQAATYGAGCWAQNSPDISVSTCTTGNGEYLMKTFLAKEVSQDLMSNSSHDCPATILHKTFKDKFLESPFVPQGRELYGGALSLVYYPKTYNGEVLWSHTTRSLCVGYMSTFQRNPKFVNSTLPSYSKPGESIVVNGQNFKLPI
ncbi:threonine aspartase 1 isoform X2 [Condylostylus longicornis]|nr:threonine aspartase 1 isoform X2 [Condylostylus longicornis]